MTCLLGEVELITCHRLEMVPLVTLLGIVLTIIEDVEVANGVEVLHYLLWLLGERLFADWRLGGRAKH